MTRLSYHARTQRRDIVAMCAYVSDDGTIMGYFGVDRAEVELIRRNAPKPPRFLRGHERYGDGAQDGDGIAQGRYTNDAAEVGSAKLRDKILMLVAREAERHDLSGEQILWLLNDRPSVSQIRARS